MKNILRRINLSLRSARCPVCGAVCKRHSNGCRLLREVGISRPTVLEVTYSKHYCEKCLRYFSIPMDHLAPPSCLFTNRVRSTAIDLVITHSLTLDNAALHMRQRHFIHVPRTTLHDWVRDAIFE